MLQIYPTVTRLPYCRVCKNKDLKKIIPLGRQPAANEFLKKSDLDKEEPHYPLQVNYCPICRQLQLSHVVSPEILFRNYVYVSSTSPVFIKHFKDYALDVFNKLHLGKNSLVVDIGSNDGILLKPFKALGTRILGVDPATKIARKASTDGIETLPHYFNEDLAKKIKQKYGSASVITANNVFAHVNDTDELISAAKILLEDEGVFIIEVPYLVVFLQKNLFDTIYHEHLSYFSVKPLQVLFKRHNMKIFDVELVGSHGGSIRVFIANNKSKHKKRTSVTSFLKKERALGLDDMQTYLEFFKRIKQNKKELVKLLRKLKRQGKKIAGFGAPAKGNTLLNFFKIGPETLDYIVDDNPLKQNLFTPGTKIPVVSSQRLKNNKPDYVFILAWNFAEPIMNKLEEFKSGGGHFIVPVPKPQIV